MEEVHNFLERLFRFILPRHVKERDSRLLLYIHFGVALANAHNPAAFGHPPCHPHDHADQEYEWEDIRKDLR